MHLARGDPGAGRPRRVPYLDAAGNGPAYEVKVIDGRLYDQDDMPLHGHYVVVTEPGTQRVYAMEWAEEGRLGAKHSTLLAGGDVQSAGEMLVERRTCCRPRQQQRPLRADRRSRRGCSGTCWRARRRMLRRRRPGDRPGSDAVQRGARRCGVPERRRRAGPAGRDRRRTPDRAGPRSAAMPTRITGRDRPGDHDRRSRAGHRRGARCATTSPPPDRTARTSPGSSRPPPVDTGRGPRASGRRPAAGPDRGARCTPDRDGRRSRSGRRAGRPPRALADLDRALAEPLGERPLLDGDPATEPRRVGVDAAAEPPVDPAAAVGAVRAVSDAQIHADVDAAGLPPDQAAALKASLIDRRDAVIRQVRAGRRTPRRSSG